MVNCNESLYFDGLEAPVYYLCGYIPVANVNDTLSKKILSFKSGNYQAKKFWLDQFLTTFKDLFAKDESELIIRSLGHNELYIDLPTDYKNPLGNLCYWVAKATNCRYAAGMLHKIKATPPLKTLSRDARWDLVKDNFSLAQFFSISKYKTIWFVDDIITTGATARATWKALLEFYPDIDFKVIALGRTVRDQDYNSNSAILKAEINENNMLREEEEPYLSNSLNALKIRFDNTDTFFK